MKTWRGIGWRGRGLALAFALAALAAGAAAPQAVAGQHGPHRPAALADAGPAADRPHRAGTYTNPVSQGFADTFADPSIIRGTDGYWYAVATSDPLRSGEHTPHELPIARSSDLVHWTHVADALNPSNEPAWADTDASYWAPDITFHDGRYWLYFVVTQTTVTPERNDNAIGVATAPTPAGPWTTADRPVVGPRRGSGAADDFKWTFDPAHVVDTDGRRYLYYGSYYGGIWVTELSADGTHAVGEPTMVATDNRFEGAYVVRRAGWWYLFASSGDCCAGPTTGYSVFVGRSRSVRGPFRDREGVSMTASRTGGTIVLTPNGNRWVGTGHNAVVTDLAGQDWIVYHAIDRGTPYLDQPYAINRRPMLIDRLDWVDGWPAARNGAGASDTPQRAPATGPGARPQAPPAAAVPERPGRPVASLSDEFDGHHPADWSWVRSPAGSLQDGRYVWPTQAGDLNKENNTASLMLLDAPEGTWTVETKVALDVGEDTVRNYQQAGLVVYVNDDEYLRLAHVAIWNTRQTEYGKEQPYAGGLSYGSMTVGPPSDTTWLRLRHTVDPRTGEHRVRAYTSRDGHTWITGGVWTLPADATLRVGLGSMGGAGATAAFDYFRLSRP
jgi:arabinan endo-1,5-alpha-L-arabinosidase